MQADLRQLHASVGIAAESWSPLAPGEVLDESAITALDRGGAHRA